MNLDWIHSPVLLAINMLAAWRITRLIVEDAFPFGVLRERIKAWAMDRWEPGGFMRGDINREDMTDTQRRQAVVYEHVAPIAYLLGCYGCMGIWTGGAVTVLASTGTWWLWVAVPLALGAVTSFLAAAFGRLDDE